MASTFTLTDIQSILRAIGRGVVFQAEYWDGTSPLALTHLGDTEGPIQFNPNGQMSYLTSEVTGPAKLQARFDGEDPTLEIPLVLADPDVRAIVNPFGTVSGGRSRGGPPVEHTLVIFPESLFIGTDGVAALSYTSGTGWTLGGEQLSAAQQEQLGNSLWLWRCVFSKPPMTFQRGDGEIAKEIQTVSVGVLYDDTKPEDHKLYTVGDPQAASINIDPTTGG